MYTIRAYYLQYCGSYAPHRRRQTPDAGRWTLDDGRRTMDAGPSTPYYKLTGELKTSNRSMNHRHKLHRKVNGYQEEIYQR